MNMNIKFNEYMLGLEEAVARFPGILGRWDEIDIELRHEYAEQLEWMLENQFQAKQMAIDEGYDVKETEDRLLYVNLSFLSMRKAILEETGLDVAEILKRK